MLELGMHLLRPILTQPDSLQLQVIETDEVTILEAILHADDRAKLESDDGRTLRAIRTVLSAGAGRSKATLEIVEAFSAEE